MQVLRAYSPDVSLLAGRQTSRPKKAGPDAVSKKVTPLISLMRGEWLRRQLDTQTTMTLRIASSCMKAS